MKPGLSRPGFSFGAVLIDRPLEEKPRYGGSGASPVPSPRNLWAMGISPQTKHSLSAQLDSTFRKLG